MANFCGKCGSPIDKATGLCPNCNKASFSQSPVTYAPSANGAVNDPRLQQQASDFVNSVQPVLREEPLSQNSASSQPISEKAKEKKGKKKAKKPMNKALSCILIILMCILTFASSLYVSLAVTIRSATTEDKLKSTVEKIDIVDALKEIPVNEKERGNTKAENYAQLICENINYTIYSKSNGKYSKLAGTRDIDKFLKESESSDYFSDHIYKYINDFYNDSNKFRLSAKDVELFLKDNEDAVCEIFNVSHSDLMTTERSFENDYIVEEKVDVLKDLSMLIIDDDDIKEFKPSRIKREMPELYNGIHYGLSYWAIVSAAFFILVLIVLMFIFNRHQTLYALGITFILLGSGLTLATALASGVIVPAITDMKFVAIIISEVLGVGIPVFVSFFLAGVLLLVFGIITSVIKKKKTA